MTKDKHFSPSEEKPDKKKVEVTTPDTEEEEKKEEDVQTDEESVEQEEEVFEAELADDEEEDETEEVEEEETTPTISEDHVRYLRLQADFDNFRKRTEREKKETIRFANEKLMDPLLEVLDNFQRALKDASDEDAFVQGMQLIQKQLEDVLKANGLEEIPTDGEAFNANLHSAVATEESDRETGTILETFRKGYYLNGRVLRPAMVKVAK